MSIRKKVYKLQNKLARSYCRRKYRNVIEHVLECNDELKSLGALPYYEKYATKEFWRWTHILAWLLQDISPGCRSLDIGPAYGTLALFAKKFLGSDVYCVDFLPLLSAQLADKYDIKLLTANMELDDCYSGDRFDFIVFTEVLEHFNFHPVPTMKKIRKLLKDDGRLYLSTPDAKQWGRTKYYKDYKDMPMPQSGKEIIDDHIYQFDWKELTDIFHESGFTVERTAYAPGPGSKRHVNVCLKRAADC